MRRSGQQGTMSSSMTQPGSPGMLRRSMSGNSGLNTLAGNPNSPRRFERERDGYNGNPCVGGPNAAYRASLVSHYAEDIERRRRAERNFEDRSSDLPGSDNLKIDSIELYPRDNAREHRTDRYEMTRDSTGRETGHYPTGLTPSLSMSNMQLSSQSSYDCQYRSQFSTVVLRRGQPFFMSVRMKERNFDPRRDVMRVTFTFGPNPQVTKGTKVVLPFRMNQREFSRAPQKWDLRVHQQEGFNVTFQVNIPANALVGLWRVTVETTSTTPGSRVDEFRFKDDMYVIFNPFCRDDPVYLDNEEMRREYVMNETGKVYVGTYNRPKGRRWVFGQFSDVALPAAHLLLDQSGLNPTERGNPVQVVRAIASIINARDGFGLLEGKWEGSFEDGVSPWSWTGSSKIFEHYLRNGTKPVKYGQCWVYAAVATSLLRALGIPSRPVTNFVSARDTNHTLSVDKYFDVFGEEMRGGPDGDNQDAVWNFHAWTECWMTRHDLPSGFNGWQAIDPTPEPHQLKEIASGEQKQRGQWTLENYRRGPTAVEAVRRGEIGYSFDAQHLFTEVNAEISHFQEDEMSHWGFRRARSNNHFVGRQILTKRTGADDDVADNDIEDITATYKSPEVMARYQKQTDGCFSSLFGQGMSYGDRERDHYSAQGTPADRMTAMNASRSVDRSQLMYEGRPVTEDVFFDLVEQEKVAYGQPFNVQIHIQNRSQEMRTISAVLTANSVYYTGVTARRLGRTDRQFVLQPGGRETLQLRVGWEDYRDKIVDYGHIKVYAMASVQETKHLWSEENDFQLEKPKLDIQVRGTPQVGQDCFVTFNFMNPVPVNLTECEFTFEGPGLARPQTVKFRDVKQGEMVSFVQKFIPRFNGERKLVATFNSRELGDIFGSRPIHVRD